VIKELTGRKNWSILNAMNREIKFRIWDEKYNAWDVSPIMLYPAKTVIKQGRVIQQFTGLKDKNGKEIYEGDIVNTIYPNDPPLNIGDVIFYKETCAFRIKTIKQLLPIVTLRFVDDKPQGLLQVADEVVGNIFENPELCAK